MSNFNQLPSRYWVRSANQPGTWFSVPREQRELYDAGVMREPSVSQIADIRWKLTTWKR